MIPNISRTFAIDLAERAGWTFVQSFIAAASLVLVGANTQNVVHLSFWQQVGAAGLGAGVGAVTSLVKGVAAGLFTGTASTSKAVAASEPAGAHAASPAPPAAAPASVPPAIPAAPAAVPADAGADVLAQADAIHPMPTSPSIGATS